MPDLPYFNIARGSAANVNVPTHTIQATITDSDTQEVLADYTGENALSWPAVLATLTTEQQDTIVNLVANRLLYMKAGIDA